MSIPIPADLPSEGILVQPAPINTDWLSIVIGAVSILYQRNYFEMGAVTEAELGDMIADVEYLLTGAAANVLTDQIGSLTDETGELLTW